MIAVAEYKFINLALLSLQEFLFPTAQMTELPVLRLSYAIMKKKSNIVLWFDLIFQHKERTTRRLK